MIKKKFIFPDISKRKKIRRLFLSKQFFILTHIYCDVTTPSLKQHLQHQQFHKYISRNFHCGYKQCNFTIYLY